MPYFLIELLGGASAGRAMLEARQKYIRENNPLHPVDLKTLAQFVLFGDPSCVPVETPAKLEPKAFAYIGEHNMRVAKRRSNRVRLAAHGMALADSIGFSVKHATLAPSGKTLDTINALIKDIGLLNTQQSSFRITGGRGFQAAGVMAKAIGQEIFHLTYGEFEREDAKVPAKIPAAAIIIVKESAGKVVSAEVVYRK